MAPGACRSRPLASGKARRWQPKRLRLRVFAVVGGLASSRRLHGRLAERWHWAAEITAEISRLQAIPFGRQAGNRQQPAPQAATSPTRKIEFSTAAGDTDLLEFVYNARKGKWLLAAFVKRFRRLGHL